MIARYYSDRDGRVFTRVSPGRYVLMVGVRLPMVGCPPNERPRPLHQHEVMLLLETGQYMRTHECVPAVACSRCKSRAGEPCCGSNGYKSTTHTVRREAYARKNKS